MGRRVCQTGIYGWGAEAAAHMTASSSGSAPAHLGGREAGQMQRRESRGRKQMKNFGTIGMLI